jgi:hypothetical protein
MSEYKKVLPKQNPDTAFAPTWNEEEQPTLEGVYSEKKTDIGMNKSNIYTIKTASGDVGVWGSKVLDDRFSEIAIGAEVKVVYLGKQRTKDGSRSFKNYELWVK